MKSDSFIDVLRSDDKNRINEFILSNGKKQKPICPIYFFSDQLKEEERHEEKQRKSDEIQHP